MINKMNKNRLNKESKSLDEYFDAASKEQIDFDEKKSRKMIAAHITAGAVTATGFSWLKFGANSWMSAKTISLVLAPIIGVGLFLGGVFDSDNTTEAETIKTEINIATDNFTPASDISEKGSEIKTIENKKNETQNIVSSYSDKNSSLKNNTTDLASSEKEESLPESKNMVSTITTLDNDYLPALEANNEEDDSEIQTEAEIKNQVLLSLAQFEPAEYGEIQFDKENMEFSETNLIIEDTEFDLDDDRQHNIIDDVVYHNGLALSAHVTSSKFNGQYGILSGGKVLWIINHSFRIGLAGSGYKSKTDHKFGMLNGSNSTGGIELGYGGLHMEYTFYPMSIVHFTAFATSGFGGFGLTDYSHRDTSSPGAAMTYFEPGLSVELNISKHIKCALAASYRFARPFKGNQIYYKNENLVNMNLDNLNFSFNLTYCPF